MRVRFDGGPWDGVQFDAPFCPDAIAFRHTDSRGEPIEGKAFAFRVRSAERNHHQYRYDKLAMIDGEEPAVNQAGEPIDPSDLLDLGYENLIVMHYRYAPIEVASKKQSLP